MGLVPFGAIDSSLVYEPLFDFLNCPAPPFARVHGNSGYRSQVLVPLTFYIVLPHSSAREKKWGILKPLPPGYCAVSFGKWPLREKINK